MKFLCKFLPVPIILALIYIGGFALIFLIPYLFMGIISWIASAVFGLYFSNLIKFIIYIVILAILIMSKSSNR